MATANENLTADKNNTLCRNDAFCIENNGTAKFLGPSTSSSSTTGTATANNSRPTDDHSYSIKIFNSTSKRSFRIELSKNELLNMLCFLEGELQAHQIVIAALKNDRIKNLLHLIHTDRKCLNDPHAALFRDKIAMSGNVVSRQSSVAAVQAEMEVRAVIEQQIESLYQMVRKQRETHVRIVKLLIESRESNQRMRQELEEEKRKHEHDTAQGDDITYGLEMERTKLKQELDTEIAARKKLEDDLKRLQETLDYVRDREKKMVLFLMAERKVIITKYVEERKRSEDLAQILSEEKQRSDTIAEDLEEESKKSLRMEAELEKQALSFDNERKALKLSLAKEEKRIKELEIELAQLKIENEALRKQSIPLRIQPSSHNVPAPTLPAKIRSVSDDTSTAAQSSMVNVAKIVQPTATVSSVPVSGPTTGIARSISPGQSLRQQQSSTAALNENINNAPPAKVTATTTVIRKLSSSSSGPIGGVGAMVQQQQPQSQLTTTLSNAIGSTIDILTNAANMNAPTPPPPSVAAIGASSTSSSTTAAIGAIAAVAGISLGKVASHGASPSSPIMSHQLQTATILRSGSISTSQQISNLISSSSSSSVSTTLLSSSSSSLPATAGAGGGATTGGSGVVGGGGGLINVPPASTVGGPINTVNSSNSGNRGVPPPIPPNKPIIPPKREPSISRLGPIATNNSNYI